METKLKQIIQNTDALKNYIESGGKLKIGNKDFETTLLHLAATESSTTVVKMLLGVLGPNCRDSLGHTPLHYAARKGRLDVVRLLVENGADPNARNVIGLTPLYFAMRSGQCEVVETLLAHGADPNARDEFGNTLLHLVSRYLTVGEVLCIVESLLAHGADPNVKDKLGNTPLHDALENPLTGEDIAVMLIDYIKDVNAKNNKGQTPLHLAVEMGYLRAVEKLLLRGADPNVRDSKGRTPLHYATEHCRVEETTLLLRWGADANVKDNNGNTPAMALKQCRSNGKLDMCRQCQELIGLFTNNGPQ